MIWFINELLENWLGDCTVTICPYNVFYTVETTSTNTQEKKKKTMPKARKPSAVGEFH